MKKLKEDIVEAVLDSTDMIEGKVSPILLGHFLDDILPKHQRSLLLAFVKDWYRENPLISEEKQEKMVDDFLLKFDK